MKVTLLKQSVLDGAYDNLFSRIYTDIDAARARYAKACDEFIKIYGEDREAELFSAPGRTEVGGNHTDHQNGCVLAGSVNLDVIAVASPNGSNIIHVKSEGYDMDTVKIDMLKPRQSENAHSTALIRGMCAASEADGYSIGGFDAYTTSNVLKGSGLSSSAAFEVLIGVIINHLFNDGKIDAVTIAKYAQFAEREFFGKPCGLMDQMASSVGGFTAIDFADTKNPVIEKVDFDFASHNHSLCIINTGGNHTDLTGDYADITVECASVSKCFGKTHLRQVDPGEFFSSLGKIRSKVSDRALLRAIHFFADNATAVAEKDALLEGDFDKFLSLINSSGNSSFKYLQNVYSISNPSEQGLSLALALTEKFLAGRGACRVHGGGFAGTIQAFVPNDMLEEYKAMIESVYGEGTCYVLIIRPFGGIKIS